MIDFKSQILFSEDPNPKNLKETLQLAKAAHNAGFTDLIAAPRFTYRKDFVSTYEYDLNKCQHLNHSLKENNINVKIHLGSEIDYSPEVKEFLKKKEIPSINGTQYTLLKFYENCNYYTVIEGAFNLQLAGYNIIISQIEKYDFVIENPSIVRDLIRRDILLQLDIQSITGAYGQKVKKTAATLLKQGMIHILGTNANTPVHYSKSSAALKKIRKIVGNSTYEEITTTNGEHILRNNLISPSTLKEKKKRKLSFGMRA